MAYSISTYAGAPAITNHDTTQKVPLGTIVRGWDATYGEGEFIYLIGVASTVVGSIVHYDAQYQTALHTSALNLPRPLAVAMSVCVGSEYGWYQISGLAVVVKANTLSLAAGESIGATSGAAVVVATGSIINGASVAYVASAVTASTSVQVMINRPHDTSDVS